MAGITATSKLIPEFCTKYCSEALQAAVDSWCKIQVIVHRDQGTGVNNIRKNRQLYKTAGLMA
jgi:hypothetical protein